VSRTDTPATIPTQRPRAATAIGVLGVLGMLGSAGMTVAHLQLEMPGVAAGFGVGVLLFAVAAYGAFRLAGWAWPVGLVVNGIALAAAILPWRGLERSGLPALVAVTALALLVSRPGRDALLYRRQR
jgi:hypothetical protein